MRKYFANAIKIKDRFWPETQVTLYMLVVSGLFIFLFGLIIGVLLLITQEGGIWEHKRFHSFLDKLTNFLRAIPFVILLAILAPLTLALVKTRIGPQAALVPLIFTGTPFFAKQVEAALSSVDYGKVEAALAMGDRPVDIVFSVYMREGLPQLLQAGSITLITLLGYIAMAGFIGAGGIGQLAISLGHNRYQNDVTLICLLITLAMVFIIQGVANLLVKKTSH
jgi:D-methionine transport system permease protein